MVGTSKIARIGLELEGGWNFDPEDRNQKDFMPHIDNSVRGMTSFVYSGEIVSHPVSYTDYDWESWIRKYYPSKVNHTCGFHIHVSFNDRMDYMSLMSNRFRNYFKQKMWEFALGITENRNLINRLEGRSRYCRTTFKPEKQKGMYDNHRDRYCHLNFSWSKYQTLECRVLPMFENVNTTIEAVHFLVSLYETYLSEPKNIIKTERLKLRIDPIEVSS